MRAAVLQQDQWVIELRERLDGIVGIYYAYAALNGAFGAFLAWAGCVALGSLVSKLPLFAGALLVGLLSGWTFYQAYQAPTERTLSFERAERRLTIVEKGQFGVRRTVVPFADIEAITSVFSSYRGAGGEVLQVKLKDGRTHNICQDKLELGEARQWCAKLNGFVAAA